MLISLVLLMSLWFPLPVNYQSYSIDCRGLDKILFTVSEEDDTGVLFAVYLYDNWGHAIYGGTVIPSTYMPYYVETYGAASLRFYAERKCSLQWAREGDFKWCKIEWEPVVWQR